MMAKRQTIILADGRRTEEQDKHHIFILFALLALNIKALTNVKNNNTSIKKRKKFIKSFEIKFYQACFWPVVNKRPPCL